MSDTVRTRVVRVGPLTARLDEALCREHGAPSLDDLTSGAGVEIAVTTGRHGVGREQLERLPDLRAIVHFGVGYDATDVAEATRRGIAISNTPDVLTGCVADAAVGLVLDVMRGLSAADRYVRRGDWGSGADFRLTRKVSGARVGILGLGRIGSAVARRMMAFGAALSYHSRTRTDAPYAYAPTVCDLAAGVDILVVTASGGAGSRGLVDAEVLDALGPDGFVVNVARGSVIDEEALIEALEQGRIAGAGLDVFADEPHVPEALRRRDDVVLLPHLGSGTEETREAMTDLALANVARFLETADLVTPV